MNSTVFISDQHGHQTKYTDNTISINLNYPTGYRLCGITVSDTRPTILSDIRSTLVFITTQFLQI